MGRRRQHDEQTGARLLDVAEDLLAARGVEAVTVRSVAEAAYTSTRAVYAVFGSKEGLLAAIAARGYRLLARLVRDVPVSADAGEDLIGVGLSGFRRFALSRPHLFRLTFDRVSPELMADRTASEALTDSYQALVARIRAVRAAGGFEGVSDAEVAFAFHSLCVGLAAGELDRRPPPEGAGFWRPVEGIDGEHLWRTALTGLVQGLRDHES